MKRWIALAVIIGGILWACGIIDSRTIDVVGTGWAVLIGAIAGALLGASWARARRGYRDYRDLAAKKRAALRSMFGLAGHTFRAALLFGVVAAIAVFMLTEGTR